MWVHIVIFMVILGAVLAGKLGRLPPWAENTEGQKLFILVALAGNIGISTIRPNRTCVTRTSHGSAPFGTGSLPSTAAPAAVAVHWAVGVR